MGQLEDKALSEILDLSFNSKWIGSLPTYQGVEVASMTVDSPIPFSLKTLWFDLLEPGSRHGQTSRSVPAVDERKCQDIESSSL